MKKLFITLLATGLYYGSINAQDLPVKVQGISIHVLLGKDRKESQKERARLTTILEKNSDLTTENLCIDVICANDKSFESGGHIFINSEWNDDQVKNYLQKRRELIQTRFPKLHESQALLKKRGLSLESFYRRLPTEKIFQKEIEIAEILKENPGLNSDSLNVSKIYINGDETRLELDWIQFQENLSKDQMSLLLKAAAAQKGGPDAPIISDFRLQKEGEFKTWEKYGAQVAQIRSVLKKNPHLTWQSLGYGGIHISKRWFDGETSMEIPIDASADEIEKFLNARYEDLKKR